MSDWYKIPTGSSITEHEYQANIRGMNVFFGAVLGFVLVGAQDLPIRDFATMLVICATIVVLIQYLAFSEYTLFNAIVTGGAIYMLPELADGVFDVASIPKLQPTLAIWAIMVLAVELMPRSKEESKKDKSKTGEKDQ